MIARAGAGVVLAATLSAAALAVSGQSLGRPAGAVRIPASPEHSAVASGTEAHPATDSPTETDDTPSASPRPTLRPTGSSSGSGHGGHGGDDGHDDHGDD